MPTAPKLVIRKVDIADTLVREQIRVLQEEVFQPDSWQGGRPPAWKSGDWWIAFAGKKPAGFAGLRPSVRWERVGYLCSAGVLPEYRGLGLQKKLIRKRVAQARAYGWNRCITDTVRDNWPSMRALIACGFRPFGPEVRWNEQGDVVYWVYDLERSEA